MIYFTPCTLFFNVITLSSIWNGFF